MLHQCKAACRKIISHPFACGGTKLELLPLDLAQPLSTASLQLAAAACSAVWHAETRRLFHESSELGKASMLVIVKSASPLMWFLEKEILAALISH
jgi:hypothetical protein